MPESCRGTGRGTDVLTRSRSVLSLAVYPRIAVSTYGQPKGIPTSARPVTAGWEVAPGGADAAGADLARAGGSGP